MTEILTKVTSFLVKFLQGNKLIEKENPLLKKRVIKLKYHSCHNNLLFHGFPESRNETDKDCYELIIQALSNWHSDNDNVSEGNPLTKFKNASKLCIVWIHWHGHYIPERNYPIVINLQWYMDKQFILQNHRFLPPGIYINEDYPVEIPQHWNLLWLML